MGQLGSHWTDFREILYLSIFRKSVEKFQVLLKSQKNNEYFTIRHIALMIVSRLIFLCGMRNISDKNCIENHNTHFMLNDVFQTSFLFWDNVEKYDTAGQTTDDNIVRRMRFTCRISKATGTHSEYVILIDYPL